jgi:hypothetical protein
VIKDLQRTTIKPKELIQIPENVPTKEARILPTYYGVTGPLFELRLGHKQLSKKSKLG